MKLPMFRRKRKLKVVDEKKLSTTLHDELEKYVTREEVQEYLEKIRKDERKRRIWNTLSIRKRMQVLKYLAEKKGSGHGKK